MPTAKSLHMIRSNQLFIQHDIATLSIIGDNWSGFIRALVQAGIRRIIFHDWMLRILRLNPITWSLFINNFVRVWVETLRNSFGMHILPQLVEPEKYVDRESLYNPHLATVNNNILVCSQEGNLRFIKNTGISPRFGIDMTYSDNPWYGDAKNYHTEVYMDGIVQGDYCTGGGTRWDGHGTDFQQQVENWVNALRAHFADQQDNRFTILGVTELIPNWDAINSVVNTTINTNGVFYLGVNDMSEEVDADYVNKLSLDYTNFINSRLTSYNARFDPLGNIPFVAKFPHIRDRSLYGWIRISDALFSNPSTRYKGIYLMSIAASYAAKLGVAWSMQVKSNFINSLMTSIPFRIAFRDGVNQEPNAYN